MAIEIPKSIAPTLVAAVALVPFGTACAPDPPAGVVGLVVDSCDPGQDSGSGMVVAPGVAITSAHVVAGADEILVRHAGGEATASVVGFDPEMDLAYVAFDAAAIPTLTVASDHVDEGDRGIAYVVRDSEIVTVPVRVRRRVNIRTEDIYVEGETDRPGFELDADIEPGDSGAAVVVDGKIAGIIWARSRQRDERAYAIDAIRAAGLIDEQLATGDLGGEVDVARCR